MADAICKNCKYFEHGHDSSHRGKCLYNPPTVIYDERHKMNMSYFPDVTDHLWCGKHYYVA